MIRHRTEQDREELEEYLGFLVESARVRRAWGLPEPDDHAAKVRAGRHALAAVTAQRGPRQLALW